MFFQLYKNLRSKWISKYFGKESDTDLGLFVYRPVAYHFTCIFELAKFTPNNVTLLSLVIFSLVWLIFVLNIIFGSFFSITEKILIVLLMQISFILDVIDGILARKTNNYSRIGGFLDAYFDRIKEFFLFFLVYLYGILVEKSMVYSYVVPIYFVVVLLSCFFDLYKVTQIVDAKENRLINNKYDNFAKINIFRWTEEYSYLVFLGCLFFEALPLYFFIVIFFELSYLFKKIFIFKFKNEN